MKISTNLLIIGSISVLLSACGDAAKLPDQAGIGPNPTIPPPNTTLIPTVNIAAAKGWPEGAQPTPASDLAVNAFATGLDHPRWLYVLPNGDVLVAETNAPDAAGGRQGHQGLVHEAWRMKKAGAGVAERQPHHAAARRRRRRRCRDAHGVPRGPQFALRHGARRQRSLRRQHRCGRALPVHGRARRRSPRRARRSPTCRPGPLNHHWTKNLIASRDGTQLYATVGSNSNVGRERHGQGRAAAPPSWKSILPPAQSRVFASGLRNPNGLAWEPETGALWTVVNERDELGSDLVPDYLTSVKDGGFYGWPYSYFGQHVDKRVKPQRPDLVAKAIVPDYALGSHTASLGLAFYARATSLPAAIQRTGLFVGAARLVESQAAQRLQGHLRAVRRRDARPAAGRCPHRLRQRGRRGARPAGRRRDRPRRRAAGRRRCRQRHLARRLRTREGGHGKLIAGRVSRPHS